MMPARVIVFVALAFAAPASAQAPTAECLAQQCERTAAVAEGSAPLWREAAAIHQIKLQFVEAFQRFLRAESGTFGDEGGALADAVESMGTSLSAWERAIAQLETRVARMTPAPEIHFVLATVWLDRHRLDKALRELDTADRSGDRADVHALRALALGALKRPSEAAQSLRRSVALNADNAAAFYTLVQYQLDLGRAQDAADARRGLERALQRQRALRRDDGRIAPFERIDLLRQTSGVAPIFPHARYASGVAALRRGDYGAAVTQLREAIEHDPLKGGAARDAVVRAARTLKDGQVDAALEALRVAAATWPDEAEVHRLLGLVYSIADEQGKSIDHLRRAMKLAPGDERALVRLADVLVSERRLAEAERELLAWPQRSGPIAYRLAQIYQKQSVLDKAAPAMQESDTFDPVIGRDYFYQSWGSLLVNQADFDGAVSAYRRRIEVNPNSAEAHRQLGEIYILQGRHEEALTELSVATWLDPADAKAHAAAGQVYARIARFPDAIGALSRALALDGTLREARYTLGTVLTRTGRAEEGKAALDVFGRQQADAEALGRREFELDALRRQASKHALAGESAEAIAVLERVASLDPESSRSHRDLGVALLRARRAVDAIEHLQRAQRLEETADGYAQLADAYAASGNADASARMRTAYMEAKQRATLDRIHELAK